MVFIVYSFVYSVTLLFCIKSVLLFSSSSSGADTLRCLGLATVDVPGPKEEMKILKNLYNMRYKCMYIICSLCVCVCYYGGLHVYMYWLSDCHYANFCSH